MIVLCSVGVLDCLLTLADSVVLLGSVSTCWVMVPSGGFVCCVQLHMVSYKTARNIPVSFAGNVFKFAINKYGCSVVESYIWKGFNLLF